MKDSTAIEDKPTSITSLHLKISVTQIRNISPSHKVNNEMVSVKDVMEWTYRYFCTFELKRPHLDLRPPRGDGENRLGDREREPATRQQGQRTDSHKCQQKIAKRHLHYSLHKNWLFINRKQDADTWEGWSVRAYGERPLRPPKPGRPLQIKIISHYHKHLPLL